jgi:hypothetical protein
LFTILRAKPHEVAVLEQSQRPAADRLYVRNGSKAAGQLRVESGLAVISEKGQIAVMGVSV